MQNLRQEGVEEKKDDTEELVHPLSPRATQSQDNDEDEQKHGFQAQMKNFARAIFGSCGTAMEAASVFVGGDGCSPRWPAARPSSQQENHLPTIPQPPPLSIADELRQLAAKEGRPFPPQPYHPRTEGIPKFLGEEAVNSFEEDDISAISQHTLEEMIARDGMSVPERMRQHKQSYLQKQAQMQQEQQQRNPPEGEAEI